MIPVQATRLLPALGLVLLAACATTRSEVSPAATQDPGTAAQMQLPPGWSAEDMQACTLAGTPGAEHARLARDVGTWSGTFTQWMAPDAPPIQSPMTCTGTSCFDGRYVKCEFESEMPGMGAFHGLGYNAFDNVARKYVSTWMDNCSTGIMTGEGTPGPDGKSMTWTFTYNCPIQKRATTMRQEERWTGDDSKTFEMFGKDPHTGREFRMMRCEMKRTSP